jgi:uncharacterized protein YyaL (SSP411 family)/cytochrome c biogenesis protein CcdA
MIPKKLLISTAIIFLLLIGIISAEEKYSFEKSESMKHLIKWNDYGPEAFEKAQKQNKPIFLLLTAPSWCYWCQVYESEDYLFNPSVVSLINEKFIPVYVDADKRQDLTRKYLEGGWPSTTIFTPSKERIFGFSGPRPVSNMISNLNNAVEHVKNNKGKLKVSYKYEKKNIIRLSNNLLNEYTNNHFNYILQAYDSQYGGFGNGQKFPQGRTLDLALGLYKKTKDKRWLDLVENTLKNQYTKIDELSSNYNLFDPIEGGFHRYGTTREWTPPHYEKMLYDNARLLKLYYNLLKINPNNNLAKEVVTKTDSFIQDKWYDTKNGGFYGNSDVHGEEAYYGKNPRPIGKPRVEKTKYTDWNSDAITTYLHLYKEGNDNKYQDMATKSLNFYLDIYDENGAYHYSKGNEKGVQGNLLDNSYLMLAFIEGYQTLGDQKYLEAAKNIADFSLDNLYDWNSGGFFERNSKDTNNYAPGENIDLDKPVSENGVIAYAMLKLYLETNNLAYLDAGIKTIAINIYDARGLDNVYHYVKSSELIIENNLLEDFDKFENDIKKIESDKLENFWLNILLESQDKGFVLSKEGLTKFDGPILLLLFISLFAGFISFASPCSLPIIPAFIAYTFKSTEKNIKGMTLSFFLGLSIVFVILGMSASFIGSLLKENIELFSQVAGIVIILLGLGMILGKGFRGIDIRYKPSGYFSSFLFGGVFGFAWTPCVGPILVAILLLASTNSSIFTGGLLLLAYAIGLSIPLIIISSYLDKIDKNSGIWKFIRGKMIIVEYKKDKKFMVHSTTLISGALFIILGWLIFSGQLFLFNQYLGDTSFQKWIFSVEEKILNLVR